MISTTAMTQRESEAYAPAGCDTRPPVWAVEQAMEIIRSHGLAIANAPDGEALQHALASMGLAIASALADIGQLRKPV
jgi:hypothetical protein